MIRLLVAAMLAVATTAGLFSLMAMMVEGGNGVGDDRIEVQPVSVLMTDRLEQTNRRERKLPEPPPPLPQMLTAQTNQANVAEVAITPPAVPDVGSVEGGGVSVAMPSRGLPQVQDRQAMPLYRVDPIYPSKAISRKLEGYVVMAFVIDESGKPKGISVVEAKPMRVFDRAAIRALSKWKYQPKLVDGKAVQQPGQTVKLEFQLRK